MYNNDTEWTKSSMDDAEKYFNLQALYEAKYNMSPKAVQDYRRPVALTPAAPPVTQPAPGEAYPEPPYSPGGKQSAAPMQGKTLLLLAAAAGAFWYFTKGNRR
jgi:hypothetical protein